jgi:cytochrome b6-f complex iron-sulfur subunit
MSAMPSNAEPQQSSLAQKSLSRRDFLSLSTKVLLGLSGLVGLAELARYLSFEPDPVPPDTYNLGPADQYPLGSTTVIDRARAVLIHSTDGFSALSLVCPHLGCTLKPEQGGYACPCHGSRFETNGHLKNGPANKPMEELRIEEMPDGRLVLQTSE